MIVLRIRPTLSKPSKERPLQRLNRTVVKLSARAGVPVEENAAGKIVGVVSAGYVVGNDAIVDKAKAMFATDFTLFLGDTRIANLPL